MVTFKLICMVIAGGLSISAVISDNYKVSMYWLFVTAYWAVNIMGG